VAHECPPRNSCRDLLLDSAEEVILRAGLGSLTLDAVAAHAKVSKGGLLYHFPSKDALILALVQRTCDNWRSDYSDAIAADPPGRGRVARALLNMCMGSTESCYETCRRSSIVLIAAIANNPALAEPLRRTHNDLLSRIREDAGDPGAGEAVVLALNGMWFEQIFGLGELPASRIKAIRAALTALADGGSSVPTRGRVTPRPARAPSAAKKTPGSARRARKQGTRP
jgi:AcrR family transcriptional regulator